MGKELLGYSSKVLEDTLAANKRGKSPRRRARSPKSKKKNKSPYDSLSPSFLAVNPLYPNIEQLFYKQLFIQQACGRRNDDLSKSLTDDLTPFNLTLNSYLFVNTQLKSLNPDCGNLLSITNSTNDPDHEVNSNAKFSDFSSQLLIQLRSKFIEFANQQSFIKEADKRKTDTALKHEQVIIFLKEYLKEFRPLTDVVISDMHAYVYKEKQPLPGKFFIFS